MAAFSGSIRFSARGFSDLHDVTEQVAARLKENERELIVQLVGE